MLEKVLKLLGFLSEDDAPEDVREKIETIIEATEDRLKNRLGGAENVPSELEPVVMEVSIARFNRISSEGTSSHSVEGESIAWSNDDDFAPFEKDIQAYLDSLDDPPTNIGLIRFY